MDSAEPSANGVSASNLLRLASLLDDDAYATRAKQTLLAFEAEVLQHPFLFASLLDAVVLGRLGVRSVVVSGEGQRVERVLERLKKGVPVGRTVGRVGKGARDGWLRGRNTVVGSVDGGREAVLVCEERACREVVGEELEELR